MVKKNQQVILETAVLSESTPTESMTLHLVYQESPENLTKFLKRLEEASCLSDTVRKALCYQLIMALVFLHKRNVIHADICPNNIRLENFTVKLKLSPAACVITPGTIGLNAPSRLYYCAPEIFHGRQYTKASDVWSLGCVLAEILRNFDTRLIDMSDKHRQKESILA